MKHFITVFLCSLVAFKSVQAVEYHVLPSDIPTRPCPGKEDNFIDKYWDDSHLEMVQIDDETVIVNGYAILIADLSSTGYALNMKVEEYRGGRWIDTALSMNRKNICQTFFDENEVWHGLVKGLPTDCPPKIGQRYDFHNRSLSDVIIDLSPGFDGVYRVELTFDSPEQMFCLVVEGELFQRKSKRG